MADRPILFSAAEGMPDWLKKLDDDSLDAIMEVVGEGEAFRRYNEGKSAMRTWFLSRLSNLAAAFAASPQVPVGEDWQDISTAPKDGTRILGWNFKGCSLMQWMDAEPMSSDSPGLDAGWLSVDDGGAMPACPGFTMEAEGQPTHWMPLPDGPGRCPICALPFKPDDMCLSDIDLGDCHAECLAGSPMVDLETGEPLPEGAPAPVPYRYDSLFKDGQR